jgi:hypothetical protein
MPPHLDVEFDHDEKVVRDGWANHFVGSMSDGGHLYLTSRRLIFRAHRVNVFKMNGTWPVADVREIIPGRVPTEMTLVLTDGSQHRFVVWQRRRWMRAIEEARDGGRTVSG